MRILREYGDYDGIICCYCLILYQRRNIRGDHDENDEVAVEKWNKLYRLERIVSLSLKIIAEARTATVSVVVVTGEDLE